MAAGKPLPPRAAGGVAAQESCAVVVVVDHTVAPANLAVVCDRLRLALARSGAPLVVCDVGALIAPDLRTVEVLARLALTAVRARCRIRVRSASRELQHLLAFAGLGEVLPPFEAPTDPAGAADRTAGTTDPCPGTR